MTTYIVKGSINGIGPRGHVIKASGPGEAWARFIRAYPQTCVHIETRKMTGDA